jgi:pyridinium-3,5-bisthiocarboxylic acid mononucleotide nickel chelatase
MPKLAYIDCPCGISGDMTLGALVDAGVQLDALNEVIGSLGLPNCHLVSEEVKRQGFRATKVNVLYAHEHEHRHLHKILSIIDSGMLTASQKETARRIFNKLAEAEAKVHGVSIEKIHFHEVGAADAIADVICAVVGFSMLGVDRIVASPVPTGSGKIKIAHGECSIPAPATAELLKNVPLAISNIQGELTTPTGAAILSVLAEDFGPLPAMIPQQIGYGAGSNDWPDQPNILRIILGEAVETVNSAEIERICRLETNLDDVSGELIGYCIERLWEARALDVYTMPIGMKKNRPGVLLSVLCKPADVACLEEIIFQETSTLGVRRSTVERRVMARKTQSVKTELGLIEGKIGWIGDGLPHFAPEYESCRRVAIENNLPLRDVYEAARKAYDANDVPSGE